MSIHNYNHASQCVRRQIKILKGRSNSLTDATSPALKSYSSLFLCYDIVSF